jgi:hypothetical protein
LGPPVVSPCRTPRAASGHRLSSRGHTDRNSALKELADA